MCHTKTYTLLLTLGAASILAPIHATEETPKVTFLNDVSFSIDPDALDDKKIESMQESFKGDNKTIQLVHEHFKKNKNNTPLVYKIAIPKEALNEAATSLGTPLKHVGGKKVAIKPPDWLNIINRALSQEGIKVHVSKIIYAASKNERKPDTKLREATWGQGVLYVTASTYTLKKSQKYLLALLIISILGGLYYFLTPQEDKNEDDNAERTPRRKEVSVSA